MTVAVMAASAVLLAPPALATAPSELPDAGPLAAVAALGVVGTGLAFVIFFGLISKIGPAKSFLVAYLAPGFAVAYGAVLLDERITVATIGGLALILAGSWLAAEGRSPLRRAVADPAAEEGGDVVALMPELPAEGLEDR